MLSPCPEMRPNMSGFGRLITAVDEKTGIVRRVDILRNATRDPRVHCVVAHPADLTPILGYTFENRGGACALTKARAATRAIGECIERYSSAFYDLGALRRNSIEELDGAGERFYPTSAFYSFSPQQRRVDKLFPYVELDSVSPINWVTATNYHERTTVLVPASCVFMPYLFHDEPITHAPISTGLAAGQSREQCIEKGAAEIVERDALMIGWKCQETFSGIEVDSAMTADSEVEALLLSTSHLSGRWFIHLLTRDIEVPVISAAFVEQDGLPLTAFGIAANQDATRALRGAIEEALLSRFLLNRSPEVINASDNQSRSYRTLRDHLFGHALSSTLKEAFFRIFQMGPTLQFDEVRERFGGGSKGQTVVNAIKSAGLDVLYADVTSRDVEALGVYSMRVLVPHAEPLDADHEAQHLGGKRLLATYRRQGSFNPFPHPFP